MTVTKNKEVDEAIKQLAQSLRGKNKKLFMAVVVELGNRVRECERYRGATKPKGAGPVLSAYAKNLLLKKQFDGVGEGSKTSKEDFEPFTDPARVNCNQKL